MIRFDSLTPEEFITHYWQQRPVVLKNALTVKSNIITPEELAGMSLEGISSRIITGNYDEQNWQIIRNITEETYTELPENNWTLLVEGVDRYIPDIHVLTDEFAMIPRFRFDDVMISYATTGGSVGPHFDYYDVFLAQYSGRRQWQLSSKGCTEQNYNPDFSLKIMQEFTPEETHILEPYDVLYVPPKYAHFGKSLDDECMTFSFGYRSFLYTEMAEFANTTTLLEGYLPDVKWHSPTTSAWVPDTYINSQDILTRNELLAFLTATSISDREIWQETVEHVWDQANEYRLHPALKVVYDSQHSVYIDAEQVLYDDIYQQDMIHFCNTRRISGSHPLTKELFAKGYLVKL